MLVLTVKPLTLDRQGAFSEVTLFPEEVSKLKFVLEDITAFEQQKIPYNIERMITYLHALLLSLSRALDVIKYLKSNHSPLPFGADIIEKVRDNIFHAGLDLLPSLLTEKSLLVKFYQEFLNLCQLVAKYLAANRMIDTNNSTKEKSNNSDVHQFREILLNNVLFQKLLNYQINNYPSKEVYDSECCAYADMRKCYEKSGIDLKIIKFAQDFYAAKQSLFLRDKSQFELLSRDELWNRQDGNAIRHVIDHRPNVQLHQNQDNPISYTPQHSLLLQNAKLHHNANFSSQQPPLSNFMEFPSLSSTTANFYCIKNDEKGDHKNLDRGFN